MNRSITLVFIISLISLGSCREDAMLGETENPIPTDVPEYYETNMNGRVLDEAGYAISDADIIIGTTTVSTDEYGFYEVSDVLVPETGLYIKAMKEGYFVGGTQYNPALKGTDATGTAFITLAKYDATSTYQSTDGVSMTLADNSSLEIPADGFTRDGNPYNGTVEVNMKWLDPTATETSALMPGALLGRTEAQEIQLLQTFGMIGVEMTDGSGTALQLAEGTEATLNFPIPNEIAGDAPAEIPLWHFDESEGVWIEEGTAVKTGDEYIGKVTHFSWWNCDIPVEYTYLCINFYGENGDPLYYGDYCIDAAGWGAASGSLYYDSYVCDLAPANVELTIQMKDDCGAVYHEQSIGSFPQGNGEAEVNVTSAPVNTLVTIEGELTDCNGDPVTNGLVTVETYYGNFTDYQITDGNYSISFNICDSNLDEVTIQGTDLNAFKQSEPATVSIDIANPTHQENLVACDVALDASMVFIFTSTGEVVELTECVARVTPKEILITSQNGGSALGYVIGVEGFSEENHSGNLLTPQLNLYGDEHGFNVTISEYGNVGGQIIGSFSMQEVSGTFVADRIQ